MFENFKSVWDIIKGRIITDLNLLGVAALLWIVAHGHSSVLPLVNMLPVVLQPIAGFILPIVFGIIVQYAIIQTRQLNGPSLVEANHIWRVGEADMLELLKSPTVKAAVIAAMTDTDKIGKPLVIGAVAAEAPILVPATEAVIERVEQAAGIATGEAIPAGEVKAPLTVTGPTAGGPDTTVAAAI